MRLYPLEVTQNVEMQRARFDAFRASFARPLEVPLAGRKLDAPQLGFFSDKPTRRFKIAGHEYAEGDLQIAADTLMKGLQLLGAPGRKLIASFDLLGRKLGQILVDNVADMFEVDCERYDLHRPAAFAFVKAAAGELAT
jgi:hypothetical protein